MPEKNTDPRAGDNFSRFEVKKGEPLMASKFNGLVDAVRRSHVNLNPGRRLSSESSFTAHYPFECYEYASPSTFRVAAGTVACSITLHPSNDDSQASPIAITVPVSSTLYKVWLALTITAATGAMTALTIDHSLAGWAIADGDAVDYPTNAPASAGAGLAPTRLYILLAEITTTAAGAWTLYPTTMTSLFVAQYVDSFSCGAAATYKMGWDRA